MSAPAVAPAGVAAPGAAAAEVDDDPVTSPAAIVDRSDDEAERETGERGGEIERPETPETERPEAPEAPEVERGD